MRGAGGHGSPASQTFYLKLIQLFKGQSDGRKLDQTCGVEILPGIEPKIVLDKVGDVLCITIDLGIDNLKFVLVGTPYYG